MSPGREPLPFDAVTAVDWSHQGDNGPEHWGDINPDYILCKLGVRQSPIDLADPSREPLPSLQLNYERDARIAQQHNGHRIDVAVAEGNHALIGEKRYELMQFHTHAPGEHLIEGEAFDMELHLVHESAAGELMVVGAVIRTGAHNDNWAAMVDTLPEEIGDTTRVADIDLVGLLAPNQVDSARYSYEGSLTTPPCSEPVHFNIFATPVELSHEQIDAFTSIHPPNNRPLQDRHERELILGNRQEPTQ